MATHTQKHSTKFVIKKRQKIIDYNSICSNFSGDNMKLTCIARCFNSVGSNILWSTTKTYARLLNSFHRQTFYKRSNWAVHKKRARQVLFANSKAIQLSSISKSTISRSHVIFDESIFSQQRFCYKQNQPNSNCSNWISLLVKYIIEYDW